MPVGYHAKVAWPRPMSVPWVALPYILASVFGYIQDSVRGARPSILHGKASGLRAAACIATKLVAWHSYRSALHHTHMLFRNKANKSLGVDVGTVCPLDVASCAADTAARQVRDRELDDLVGACLVSSWMSACRRSRGFLSTTWRSTLVLQ